MVDIDGSVEVASVRADGQRGEQRKVDLIVQEMKRYDVKMAALQETKWFRCEMYQVGGGVVLTAEREKPALEDNWGEPERAPQYRVLCIPTVYVCLYICTYVVPYTSAQCASFHFYEKHKRKIILKSMCL